MHVSPVLIYGVNKENGKGLLIDSVKEAFRDCLTHSPILTQKLVSLPMGMDEPYWVNDRAFNLEQHISEVKLPSPGSWQQLKSVLARVHANGLDMERPLWQASVITGLNDIKGLPSGSTAVVLKIHHAAIDGVSLALFIAALHDDKIPTGSAKTSAAQVPPDQIEMWNRANTKQWTRPIKLLHTIGKLIPAVSKLRELKTTGKMSSTIKHSKTRFNAEVTYGRVIGTAHIALQDLKTIKRVVRRVTLNDIAVAIVGGALRQYLMQHRELPNTSLVCGAPINLRSRGDGRIGNNIATMQVGLATDVADPVERVRAVHQYALMGKAKINTLGTGTVMDISDSLAPGLLAEGLRAISFASTRVSEIPVPFHVMISNVPGPIEPIALHGAPLQLLLGLGPIRHSMGLFHVVSNTAETYTITFTSCSSILPDADFYEQCLRESVAELMAAVS